MKTKLLAKFLLVLIASVLTVDGRNFIRAETSSFQPTSASKKKSLKTFKNASFQFMYPRDLHIYREGPKECLVSQDSAPPKGGFEDVCGTSRDYVTIQALGSYKNIYVYSKYSSIDALVNGLEHDFDNGEKISDEYVKGLRIVKFTHYEAPNYYLIDGDSVYAMHYQRCAGGGIHIEQLVSTFQVVH